MTGGLSCDLARASAATTRKTAEGIPSDSSHAVSEPRAVFGDYARGYLC
jgi:hypothetical protein